MQINITRTFALSTLVLALSTFAFTAAQAQTPAQGGSTVTRAQVKMDRDAFLAMARWDAELDNWVLKDNMPMPGGVLSRSEVKAMRDKFLSMHTWDENNSKFVPITGAPRDMSKLTRAQVKAETVRFLKMHRFNEATSEWVAKGG